MFHDVIDADTAGTIELCMPVASEVAFPGDVVCRELPAVTVASVTHKGPYDEVAPAYHVITSWMHEHGHTPSGPPRELYLNDPTQVEPGEQLTEVQWPFEE